MTAAETPLATLERIAGVNAEFGAVAAATPDFMIRVGESMLKKQSIDLRTAHALLSDLVDQGDRLTATFRALGLDNSLIDRSRLAQKCEESLIAFDAALARAKGGAA
ncbi:TPA: hypothetical protein ACGCGR_000647 [Stenotrophomonas maltophilia]